MRIYLATAIQKDSIGALIKASATSTLISYYYCKGNALSMEKVPC